MSTSTTGRIAEAMIAELQHEAASTRKLIERLPDAKWGWKPHPRSMSLGELTSHIADSLGWTAGVVDVDTFALDPMWKPYRAAHRAEALATFDKNVASAIAAMRRADDASMGVTWKMVVQGKTVLELPRGGVLRSMVLNHMVHHRGQLDVYARLLDVPLPPIYGPTADEPGM